MEVPADSGSETLLLLLFFLIASKCRDLSLPLRLDFSRKDGTHNKLVRRRVPLNQL